MEEFFEDDSTLKPIPSKQQISVPFLWEERPGKPKKDCYLESTKTKTLLSNPFGREEKSDEPPPLLVGELPLSNNPFICNSEEKEMFKSYLESFEFVDIIQSIDVKESGSDDHRSTSETTESTEGRYCLSRSSSSSTCDDEAIGINGDVSVVEFFIPSSTLDEVLPQKACFVVEEEDRSVVPLKNGNKRYDLIGERDMTLQELIVLSRNMKYCGRKESLKEEKKTPKKKILGVFF